MAWFLNKHKEGVGMSISHRQREHRRRERREKRLRDSRLRSIFHQHELNTSSSKTDSLLYKWWCDVCGKVIQLSVPRTSKLPDRCPKCEGIMNRKEKKEAVLLERNMGRIPRHLCDLEISRLMGVKII